MGNPLDADRYKFDTYTKHVLKYGQTTKQYEDEAKRRFIEEPANMKLLIVVSKLLTGFDAPSCTYIYLDNELRDHNLFQAICRTNRLDFLGSTLPVDRGSRMRRQNRKVLQSPL